MKFDCFNSSSGHEIYVFFKPWGHILPIPCCPSCFILEQRIKLGRPLIPPLQFSYSDCGVAIVTAVVMWPASVTGSFMVSLLGVWTRAGARRAGGKTGSLAGLWRTGARRGRRRWAWRSKCGPNCSEGYLVICRCISSCACYCSSSILRPTVARHHALIHCRPPRPWHPGRAATAAGAGRPGLRPAMAYRTQTFICRCHGSHHWLYTLMSYVRCRWSRPANVWPAVEMFSTLAFLKSRRGESIVIETWMTPPKASGMLGLNLGIS